MKFGIKNVRWTVLLLLSEEFTVSKLATPLVDEKPEMHGVCLKMMVGERGFEPPTPGPEPNSILF